MDVLRTVEQSSVAELVELVVFRCLRDLVCVDTTLTTELDMTWLGQFVVEDVI